MPPEMKGGRNFKKEGAVNSVKCYRMMKQDEMGLLHHSIGLNGLEEYSDFS